jgi:hypothetical protein
MGHKEMPVPDRPDIRLLGRTSDEDKFDALAGCVALVQPSLLESLSIIALEAWACGRPVICDVRSPVVWGMTYRAGAGSRIAAPPSTRRSRDAHRPPAARVAARRVRSVIRRAHIHLAARGRDVPRSLRRGTLPQRLNACTSACILCAMTGKEKVDLQIRGVPVGLQRRIRAKAARKGVVDEQIRDRDP